MRKKLTFPALFAIVLLLIAGCNKTGSNFANLPLKDYSMPLQVGKYVTYRLDSLTFYYYGQLDTITSYLAKDSVEATTMDNMGRPSWVVVRYLNDTTGTGPWTSSLSYLVTLTPQTMEVVENNIRFVKLASPIDVNDNWNGDVYAPINPYQDLFQFSNSDNTAFQNWNFSYQNINQPMTLSSGVFDSTVTVLQVNDSNNLPIAFNPDLFASKTYWSETYAKNIGLVYRHVALWEYEPPSADGSTASYKIGFEMTLSIIDHN
jgi:hypothetical protein